MNADLDRARRSITSPNEDTQALCSKPRSVLRALRAHTGRIFAMMAAFLLGLGALVYAAPAASAQPAVAPAATSVVATPDTVISGTGAVQLAVTITCATAPGAVSGTVQFVDTVGATSTNIDGPLTVSGASPVNASVFWTPPATTTSATHRITAHYTPAATGSDCAASTVATETPDTVTVNPAVATGVVVTAPAAVAPNTAFTVSARVTCPPGGTPATGGRVDFYDNNSYIATTMVLANGTATLPLAGLPAGVHVIRADYVPGPTGTCGFGSGSTTVNVGTTSTTITPTTVVAGGTFFLTATVTCPGGGHPTSGTVTFTFNGITYANVPVNGAGVAQVPVTAPATAGSYNATATFNGAPGCPAQTTPTVTPITVQPAPVCTTINYYWPGNLNVTSPICLGPNARIDGSVIISGAGSLVTQPGAVIGGAVTANSSTGGVRLCGTTVYGPVTLSNLTAPIVIGGPGCAGNTIYGSVNLNNDSNPTVAVNNNRIDGSVSCYGSPSAAGTGNFILGSRNCPGIS